MKNEYGLDLDYFKKLIKRELGDISRFKPDEFARVCLRMSVTAESSVINEPEFSKLTDLQKQNNELRAKVGKYESALNSVIDLIDNSTGVAGLHQNGEVAEWDSILAGGHFEEWLIDLSEAININHANRIKEG